MSSPTNRMDDLVHQRHRLGILSTAAETRDVEFGYLREVLDLTPGNLNRHLAALENAGLIKVKKQFQARKPKTWIAITKRGSTALSHELTALQDLITRHTEVNEDR